MILGSSERAALGGPQVRLPLGREPLVCGLPFGILTIRSSGAGLRIQSVSGRFVW
jgi:hypothetical protein